MELTAIKPIEVGHVVAIKTRYDGHCTAHSINLSDEIIIGLAAHDIEAGEIVEYRPNKNTKDVLTKGLGFDPTGQSWSWSIEVRENER